MVENSEQGLASNSENRRGYKHLAAVQHDGSVPTGHTIEFYDEEGRKQRKTGSTVTNPDTREYYGRVNHIDETNGGAAAAVGWARVDKDNATFNITADEEEDLDIVLKEAIIVDSITWNQRTGQTSAFNAHNFSAQLNVDGTIIEASSHYVCSDGAGQSVKTLGSGSGVSVPAGSRLQIEATGATLASGDDVYGLEWIIVYRKA